MERLETQALAKFNHLCDVARLLSWTLPVAVVIYWVADTFSTWKLVRKHPNQPLVGSPLLLAPSSLLNLNFAARAAKILRHGYDKFKHSAFQLVRNDGSVVVLPQSLLEELTVLPATIASPQGALEHDLLGSYTGLNLIIENRLHHTIVQRRLTPRLPLLVPRLQNAVNCAFDKWFPQAYDDRWSTFQPYQVLGRVSARMAAEVVVGPAFRDNETWLDISFNYTENLFRTIVVLRLFPDWFKPMVAPLLPSYWEGQRYIQLAIKTLRPNIQDLMDKHDAGVWAPEDDNVDDLNILNWLSAMAKGRDRDARVIAHVQVLVALASVHTTLLRIVNVLYDIIAAGPSLHDSLLGEIAAIEDSEWAAGTAFDRLHKLDSVLRESQRLSPPTTLGLKRLFKEPYTFTNGTHVTAGTYVCMPITAIENDPENTPNPEKYDGLRAYRQWEEAQSKGDKVAAKEALFTTPTKSILNFGYGKSACPGRFFAGAVIKIALVKLLSEYDFAFVDGASRPKNLEVHEFLFTWPWQKLLIRRKKHGICPF